MERGDRRQRLAAAVRGRGLEAFVAQGHRQQLGDALLVVDDQDARVLFHLGSLCGCEEILGVFPVTTL